MRRRWGEKFPGPIAPRKILSSLMEIVERDGGNFAMSKVGQHAGELSQQGETVIWTEVKKKGLALFQSRHPGRRVRRDGFEFKEEERKEKGLSGMYTHSFHLSLCRCEKALQLLTHNRNQNSKSAKPAPNQKTTPTPASNPKQSSSANNPYTHPPRPPHPNSATTSPF